MAASALGAKPKILVVDDQEIVRYTMDVVLTQQGYRCIVAESIQEGIELLGSQRPDLVLLDITMPGGDGLVLLRQMRQSAPFRLTPVIILTGHSDRGFIGEALSLGVRDYVLKAGFLIDDLLARVRQRLEECGALPPEVHPHVLPPPEASLSAPPHMELSRVIEGGATKVFPSSRQRLQEACSSSLASLPAIEAILRDDPLLSAAVLSRAQAALTRPRSLLRLSDAVQLLGIAKTGEIAAELPVYSDEDEIPGDLVRAHAQAVFCARWMERFCPEVPAAGLAGLLHGLAEMLLMQRLSETEWASLRESARGRGRLLTRVVEEAFGVPYAELAQVIFQRLGLPPSVSVPVLEYARAFQGGIPAMPSRDALRISTAVQWANALAMATTPGAAVLLTRRDELEPRLLTEEIALLPLLCDDAWNVASHAAHGLRLPPGAFRLAMPPLRPRIVLATESWVASPSPLERLLAELCVVQRGDVEGLRRHEWDAFVYLGDHPNRIFANGYPHPQPLVVLHQLPAERCGFPAAPRLEALRMPAPLSQVLHLFEQLGS